MRCNPFDNTDCLRSIKKKKNIWFFSLVMLKILAPFVVTQGAFFHATDSWIWFDFILFYAIFITWCVCSRKYEKRNHPFDTIVNWNCSSRNLGLFRFDGSWFCHVKSEMHMYVSEKGFEFVQKVNPFKLFVRQYPFVALFHATVDGFFTVFFSIKCSDNNLK